MLGRRVGRSLQQGENVWPTHAHYRESSISIFQFQFPFFIFNCQFPFFNSCGNSYKPCLLLILMLSREKRTDNKDKDKYIPWGIVNS